MCLQNKVSNNLVIRSTNIWFYRNCAYNKRVYSIKVYIVVYKLD